MDCKRTVAETLINVAVQLESGRARTGTADWGIVGVVLQGPVRPETVAVARCAHIVWDPPPPGPTPPSPQRRPMKSFLADGGLGLQTRDLRDTPRVGPGGRTDVPLVTLVRH